jgi:hypothetical protein
MGIIPESPQMEVCDVCDHGTTALGKSCASHGNSTPLYVSPELSKPQQVRIRKFKGNRAIYVATPAQYLHHASEHKEVQNDRRGHCHE